MATIYGNGLINGTASIDSIFGGARADTVQAGAGNDVVHGLDANDLIYGGDGNDYLYGELGNDSLYGGAGNDTLSSHEGNDLLVGGAGSDLLKGGAGSDVFVFNRGDSSATGGDRITDFQVGIDDIKFVGISVREVVYRQTATGTDIDYEGLAGTSPTHGTIHLDGVHGLNGANDFIFG